VRGRMNMSYLGTVNRIESATVLECEDCPSGVLAVSVAWQSQVSSLVKFVA
jgi:hypothetical protein